MALPSTVQRLLEIARIVDLLLVHFSDQIALPDARASGLGPRRHFGHDDTVLAFVPEALCEIVRQRLHRQPDVRVLGLFLRPCVHGHVLTGQSADVNRLRYAIAVAHPDGRNGAKGGVYAVSGEFSAVFRDCDSPFKRASSRATAL